MRNWEGLDDDHTWFNLVGYKDMRDINYRVWQSRILTKIVIYFDNPTKFNSNHEN